MPRKPRLSWQLKAKIFEFAASCGRDDLAGIQRSLDTWLRSLPAEEQLMETAPDKRTIRRIVDQELDKLSPDVVIAELPSSVWPLRKDYEYIKELAEGYGSEALLLDRKKFYTSDSFMTERDLTGLLLTLEVHHSYKASEFVKIVKFCDFFRLEGNRYSNIEVRDLQDKLWNVVDRLVMFLLTEFAETTTSKQEKVPEFELSPSGLKYLRDEKSRMQHLAEAKSQLHQLIDLAREAYKVYRAGIRSKLHL
jgi:hypothetical protein